MPRSIQNISRELLAVLVAVGAQIPILDAHAIPIGPAPNDGSTVWTDNRSFELNVAEIGAVVGVPALALLYEASFGNARVTSAGGADAQVTFTAVEGGTFLNDVTVEIVDPGAANSPLSVSVSGHAIRISLATDVNGAVTSTATQVAAAVNASPAATALVAASTAGTGAGVAQTLSVTSLVPVIVEGGPFASAYGTIFANSATSPQDATVSYGGGTAISATSLFLYVRDGDQTPASYIYDLLAPGLSWNGIESLSLGGFWPNDGAIEQIKIVGIARGPTPVSEGSSLALLMLGIGVLGWSRTRALRRA